MKDEIEDLVKHGRIRNRLLTAKTMQTEVRAAAKREQWRDHAGRVRPLESAPITSEKRERIAEWMWYSNRANELAALLTTPEEPK